MATKIEKHLFPQGLEGRIDAGSPGFNQGNLNFGNIAFPSTGPDFEANAPQSARVQYSSGEYQVESQVPNAPMLRQSEQPVESDGNSPGIGRRGAEKAASSSADPGSDSTKSALAPTGGILAQSQVSLNEASGTDNLFHGPPADMTPATTCSSSPSAMVPT